MAAWTGGDPGTGAGSGIRAGLPGPRPDQQYRPVGPQGPVGSSSSTLLARRVIVSGPGEGMFSYSPRPGPGNLVASTGIAAAGTDNYGNAYLPGDTTYVQFPNGVWVAQQVDGATQTWLTASSEAGPWVAFGSETFTFLGPGGSAAVGLFPSFGHMTAPGGAGHYDQIWLQPSGDTSGAQDWTNINNVLAGGSPVCCGLMPGLFWINQPIVINSNYQVLQGAGFPFTTTIASAFTSPTAQMVLVSGATAPLFEVTVRDLALKGNANTGNGLVFRSNNGLVENVIVQGNGLTGNPFHFSLDSLPATPVFDVTGKNCYALQPGPAGSGYFFDANYNSCELVLCRTQGGTSPAAKASAWGFQLLGSEIKLLLCHADLYLTGGALLSGAGRHQAIGGEYETNAGPGIQINGASDCKVIGTSHYGNTGTQDIAVTSGAQYNSIIGTTHESPGVTSAITLDGTVSHNGITSCRSKIGKSINAAAGGNFLLASLNDFAGTAITHSGANDVVVNNL